MNSDNKIEIFISRQTYSNSGYFVWRNIKMWAKCYFMFVPFNSGVRFY